MTSPVIDVSPGGLSVDGVAVAFPIPTNELVEQLGIPERWVGKYGNTVLTWHDLGIYAHAAGDDHVKTICVELRPEVDAPAFRPRSAYAGTLRVDGETVKDRVPGSVPGAKRVAGTETSELQGLKLHADYEGEVLRRVEITSASKVQPRVPPERYETRRSEGEPLSFTDLNFKLAVIDELMFQQDAVEPRFSFAEFVRWYDARVIDVNDEGARPIPEVLEYFRQFEIDQELAGKVRELVVDAGNAIYQQIAPRWGGEDDTFDIGTWDDVALLPNLRRIDVISLTPDDAAIEALRARGIEVEA